MQLVVVLFHNFINYLPFSAVTYIFVPLRMSARFCGNNPLVNINGYTFFKSNLIFRLSLELLSEVPKIRLKIAMKLQTFFGDFRLK